MHLLLPARQAARLNQTSPEKTLAHGQESATSTHMVVHQGTSKPLHAKSLQGRGAELHWSIYCNRLPGQIQRPTARTLLQNSRQLGAATLRCGVSTLSHCDSLTTTIAFVSIAGLSVLTPPGPLFPQQSTLQMSG